MTSKWNHLPKSNELQPTQSELAERYADYPAISTLLAERGVTTVEEADKFFHPSLRDLHDPFLMRDMDKAVDRLNRAIGAKERIMVFGDYDVDGTTAVAIVYRYLTKFYSNVEYYIPSRDDEGYGISEKSIDAAAESGIKLVIILDCGIKAVDEIHYAKQHGIDFIICDHHVSGDSLPEAVAILNPKLPESGYPCPHLSGCGVGFKFMQAFAKSNGLDMADLENMLDLVAVSITADIVPMVGENRIMTYYGLKRLNQNPSLGLRAIMKICKMGKHEVTVNDLIFKIGPRINASGRMQSGMEAVQLLVTRSFSEACDIAESIDQYNQDRKELDKRITDEASAVIEANGERLATKKSLVIFNKDWHRGIIGIVASRLTELYFKPTVVLTMSNGLATGSSRSVQGFDIYSAIESTADLLENFGGHPYAVGLSLRDENIPEFRRRFEAYVAANILPQQMRPQIDIDADITFNQINPKFLDLLRKFNPFGPSNQKPVFCTRNVRDYGTSKLVGRKLEHIKLELVDDTSGRVINGIAFNMAEHFDHIHSGKPFDICYTIEENHRGNKTNMQLFVKEIHS
ncbi:MAG: single-stranded-DNA-specific exonuclease RecJ [Muribaculaceae bacterium]|nr:single-stranded-DNA-specific exonuclease RecJ [Muribaculaceae bacterium]